MSHESLLHQIRLPRDRQATSPQTTELSKAELSRRQFMKLVAASAAFAATSEAGCDRTVPEKILPYSVRPEHVTPGIPLDYATHWLRDGFAVGLLARSNEGRPTKMEGNPDHPASLGGTTLQDQALVLGVYDPDRAGRVLRGGAPSTWESLQAALRAPRTDQGAGLRLVLEPTTSDAVARLVERVRRIHPRMRVVTYAPTSAIANTEEGARLAFGRSLLPIHDLSRADVIVSLESDLLCDSPLAARYARLWADRRRSPDRPNRMFAVECMPSVTGMAADHRLRARSTEILPLALALARAIAHARGDGAASALHAIAATPGPMTDATSPHAERWIAAAARALDSAGAGRTLVVAGERQPPAVHALVVAINEALGNVGQTVSFVPSPLAVAPDLDLAALARELRDGHVDTVILLDGNPVYTAPADLDLPGVLPRARERIYVGPYENETASLATWFAPLAHPLESWGDGRALDGTLSFSQPLLHPRRGGKSVIEVLAILAGERAPDGRRLVRETHEGVHFERACFTGCVPETRAQPIAPGAINQAAVATAIRSAPPILGSVAGDLELNLLPSPTILDGRFANNAWLLEQPDPVAKLTWDNALFMSAKTAARLGLKDEQLCEIEREGRILRGPALAVAGHADEAVTIWLGYGRKGGESLAENVGANAYPLRTSARPHFTRGLRARPIDGTHPLARTQLELDLHGRDIAITTTRSEHRKNPDLLRDQREPQPSLMPPVEYRGLQWAMSIDLTVCTGCSACMLACQSENNLPLVGKEHVLEHRQMHWLRVDTYLHGGDENPGVVHQPMMCQHCETAPCEYVCPVNATVHSPDGLNEMVYNRCVGTRFCSNNCPYKVRRFNWFNWTRQEPQLNGGPVELVHNPDVTVRDRGVMEKCTYCVQRIRGTEIRARVENRDVRPGEVVTACQQACPTGAIQFGSLSHEGTKMVEWRRDERAYAALGDQGTRPRTMYLARLVDEDPELD